MPEITNFKEEAVKVSKEARHQTVGYITAALGLIAGLAWNDAIKSLIEYFFPAEQNMPAKFIYAVLITIVVVVLTMYLSRLFKRDENKSV